MAHRFNSTNGDWLQSLSCLFYFNQYCQICAQQFIWFNDLCGGAIIYVQTITIGGAKTACHDFYTITHMINKSLYKIMP